MGLIEVQDIKINRTHVISPYTNQALKRDVTAST